MGGLHCIDIWLIGLAFSCRSCLLYITRLSAELFTPRLSHGLCERRRDDGRVTLHRHLVNRPGIQLQILPAVHHEIVRGAFHSKIIPRLMRTPARRWAGDIDYLM